MAHFKKGMEVHTRDHNGRIDTRNRYTIRSCGKKQAILDYIRNENESSSYYGNRRGSAYYITEIEQARSRYGDDIPSYVKTSWDQYFVLAGADGWDACEN